MSEEKQEPGFEINGQFYAMPSVFRLGDPVLVEKVTGMEFPHFAEAIDDEDRRKSPTILAGLIAVAIWQKHPNWSREKVANTVERINMEDLDFKGGDDEDEALPPPVATEPVAPHSAEIS